MTNKTMKGKIPAKHVDVKAIGSSRCDDILFTCGKDPKPKMIEDDIPFVHTKLRGSVVFSNKNNMKY